MEKNNITTDVGEVLRGLSHKELIDLIRYSGNIQSATQLTAVITMLKDKQLLDMHQNNGNKTREDQIRQVREAIKF